MSESSTTNLDDMYAMYACKQCKYVVTAFDTVLPCPKCGNLSYRKLAPDDPLIAAQRPS